MYIANGEDKNYWSYIKWTSALYNFKKLKFGCSSIEYNENTGRVNYLKFEEK